MLIIMKLINFLYSFLCWWPIFFLMQSKYASSVCNEGNVPKHENKEK